jgi:hypothetical protein
MKIKHGLLLLRKHLSTLAVAVVGCLAAPAVSLAGVDNVIATQVLRLWESASYSKEATTSPARPALQTYVGYRMEVANVGGNTTNNVRVRGSAVTVDGGVKLRFSSAEGATCATTNVEGTDIECTLGQLRAGQAHPQFVVFFRTPVAPPAPTATQAVAFSGTTLYSEGTGGPDPVWANSTQPWIADGSVSLDAPSGVSVKSVVQRSGGMLFTGDGGISTAADPFTTSVVVPPSATFTTALITESAETVNCTFFTACNVSQVSIPGQFSPYMTIVLRQDASSIVSGTKLGSVVVYYLDDAAPPGTPYMPLGACASPNTPNEGALYGVPCIAESKHYKSRKVPGWTLDLDGDFEWTILNRKNGGYKVL